MLALKLHFILFVSCFSFFAEACVKDSSYASSFHSNVSQLGKLHAKIESAGELEEDPEQDEWQVHFANATFLDISPVLWEAKPFSERIQASLDTLVVLDRLNLPPPLV